MHSIIIGLQLVFGKTKWVKRLFTAWKAAVKVWPPYYEKQFCDLSDLQMNALLCKFILEVRTVGGKMYSPRVLQQIIYEMQRLIGEEGVNVRLLDSDRFRPLRKIIKP